MSKEQIRDLEFDLIHESEYSNEIKDEAFENKVNTCRIQTIGKKSSKWRNKKPQSQTETMIETRV